MEIKIKKFKIIEITENKFGEFDFSDSVNIISANNKRGKSTFIKSLMYCLGFEIKKWADKFDKNNFIFIVTCAIGDKEIQILRFRDEWIINKEICDRTKYRKFLKENLQIISELTSHKNTKHIPYPTDLFLFNYVDQDTSYYDLFKGNHSNWGMYKSKEVYKLYREFIGISNEEIEKLETKKNNLVEERKLIESEQKTLEIMLKKYNNNDFENISLKAEEYRNEMRRIEKLTNDFLSNRNELEQKKFKILNEMKQLDFERIQLEEIYKELEKNTARVHCKFCNSLLNQSFAERYQRELNKNSLILQYADIKKQITQCEEKLEKNNKDIESCEEKLENIQNLFNKTKKDLKFSEIIESNIKFGIKKELQENFDVNKILIDNKSSLIRVLTSDIKKKKKNTEEREKEIIKFYEKKIKEVQEIFPKVDLSNLENNFMNFESKRTGADNNIITVITYYIYFSTLTEFSKIKFPIIWDTFLKEVLDKENSDSMEELVNKKILKLNTQLICSNVPDTIKEVKISDMENYNVISIKDKLCFLNIGVKENQIISEIYTMMQN